MSNDIAGFVQAQVGGAVKRAGTSAAFALIAGLFVLFALIGLFAALFFVLERDHGPVNAALLCAAAAFVLAVVAALPLMFGGRRKPPPPQQNDDMLPRFVSLMARSAPGLGPRQLIVTAALVGVALFLTARGGSRS